VEALAQVARGLPADLPAAVFVVLHVPPYGTSVLPEILARKGCLPALHAVNDQKIESGRIYIAPPDHHLIIRPGVIHVSRGPSENGHRPAIDPLFRSAARSYDSRVIGVILSGTLDDGTAGLLSIKQHGGLAVVQDPEEALFSGMPRSAVEHVETDWIGPLDQIAEKLVQLAQQTAEEKARPAMSHEAEVETEIAEMKMAAIEAPRTGTPTGFTCPECHGVLWEMQDGGMIRFRCRVGHAFSPDSLLAEQSQSLEDVLWTALRALEESAALAARLQDRAQGRGHSLAARRFGDQAGDALQRANTIRSALLRGQFAAPNPLDGEGEHSSALNGNPGGEIPVS
jgi:two-component system chemotaxis response regulator CheB